MENNYIDIMPELREQQNLGEELILDEDKIPADLFKAYKSFTRDDASRDVNSQTKQLHQADYAIPDVVSSGNDYQGRASVLPRLLKGADGWTNRSYSMWDLGKATYKKLTKQEAADAIGLTITYKGNPVGIEEKLAPEMVTSRSLKFSYDESKAPEIENLRFLLKTSRGDLKLTEYEYRGNGVFFPITRPEFSEDHFDKVDLPAWRYPTATWGGSNIKSIYYIIKMADKIYWTDDLDPKYSLFPRITNQQGNKEYPFKSATYNSPRNGVMLSKMVQSDMPANYVSAYLVLREIGKNDSALDALDKCWKIIEDKNLQISIPEEGVLFDRSKYANLPAIPENEDREEAKAFVQVMNQCEVFKSWIKKYYRYNQAQSSFLDSSNPTSRAEKFATPYIKYLQELENASNEYFNLSWSQVLRDLSTAFLPVIDKIAQIILGGNPNDTVYMKIIKGNVVPRVLLEEISTNIIDTTYVGDEFARVREVAKRRTGNPNLDYRVRTSNDRILKGDENIFVAPGEEEGAYNKYFPYDWAKKRHKSNKVQMGQEDFEDALRKLKHTKQLYLRAQSEYNSLKDERFKYDSDEEFNQALADAKANVKEAQKLYLQAKNEAYPTTLDYIKNVDYSLLLTKRRWLSLTKKLQDNYAESKALADKLGELENIPSSELMADTQAEVDALENEIQTCRRQEEETKQLIDDYKDDLEQLQKQIQDLMQAISSKEGNLSAIVQQIQDLVQKKDSISLDYEGALERHYKACQDIVNAGKDLDNKIKSLKSQSFRNLPEPRVPRPEKLSNKQENELRNSNKAEYDKYVYAKNQWANYDKRVKSYSDTNTTKYTEDSRVLDLLTEIGQDASNLISSEE